MILLSLTNEILSEVVDENNCYSVLEKGRTQVIEEILNKLVILNVVFVYLANVKKYIGKRSS
jgi:hypothetical protein